MMYRSLYVSLIFIVTTELFREFGRKYLSIDRDSLPFNAKLSAHTIGFLDTTCVELTQPTTRCRPSFLLKGQTAMYVPCMRLSSRLISISRSRAEYSLPILKRPHPPLSSSLLSLQSFGNFIRDEIFRCNNIELVT